MTLLSIGSPIRSIPFRFYLSVCAIVAINGSVIAFSGLHFSAHFALLLLLLLLRARFIDVFFISFFGFKMFCFVNIDADVDYIAHR